MAEEIIDHSQQHLEEECHEQSDTEPRHFQCHDYGHEHGHGDDHGHGHGHSHDHGHGHEHGNGDDHGHRHGPGHRHGHGHGHRHRRGDGHGHEHEHEHGNDRGHKHGHGHHHGRGDGHGHDDDHRHRHGHGHKHGHGQGHGDGDVRGHRHGHGHDHDHDEHRHGDNHGHRHCHGQDDDHGHEHGHGDDHGHGHGHGHDHGHRHEHGNGDDHGHRHGPGHRHDHGHDHGHKHGHGDDHGHGHGHGHDHGHDHEHGNGDDHGHRHGPGHRHGHSHGRGHKHGKGSRHDHEHGQDSSDDGSTRKYPLIYIRGLAFPSPFLLASNVEAAIDFKPRDSDIFIVTYPKCGTTWTQYMVWEILHKGAVPPSPNQIVFRDFPFLEFTDMETVEDIPPPRTMKTHLPFNLQPYNPKTKFIYIVRNPWDCCVSYYYHHQIDPAMPQLTFDEYFEEFIKGEVGWGDFFDHVLSWFKHRNDPNVLFLKYEEMKKDKKKTLLGIAKFLGESHYRDVQDEEILANCLKHSDFKYMKELGMFFPKGEDKGLNSDTIKEITKQLGDVDRSKANPEEFTEVDFFRKGEVGDWKNHFTPSHVKKFNEYMMRKLKNTEMENFWQPLQEETSL